MMFPLSKSIGPLGVSTNASSAGIGEPTDYLRYYTMDAADLSGTTITDKGSDGANLTFTGTLSTSAGHIAECMTFTGSSPQPHSATGPNVDSAITLAYWIFIPSSTITNQSTYICAQGIAGGDNHELWSNSIFVFQTNLQLVQLQFQAPNFGGTDSGGIAINVGTATDFLLDAWNHVAFTAGPGGYTVWVNGALKGSNTVPYATSHSGPFHIASRAPGGGTTQFSGIKGSLDDFRIYNRVLTSTEIAALAAM
jgi:hypothetical protein